jgi:hypothetical protein
MLEIQRSANGRVGRDGCVHKGITGGQHCLSNGVGMKENLVVSKPKGEDQLSEDLIREELSRILESFLFAQSDRLCRFLRFTVETTLAGEADTLKEYLIGTEVYERNSSYHPSEDSIVRSEARRLRSKLKEYYDSVGKRDPVLIHYRPGSYVPVFRPRPSEGGEYTSTNAKPGEFLIRIWRNVQTDGSNGVQVEVQARITNDQARHEETASYAYDLLHRLASFAAKDATPLESNLVRETVSTSVAKPIPIKSRSTRSTEGKPVFAATAKVDRVKTRWGQGDVPIRKTNFRQSTNV